MNTIQVAVANRALLTSFPCPQEKIDGSRSRSTYRLPSQERSATNSSHNRIEAISPHAGYGCLQHDERGRKNTSSNTVAVDSPPNPHTCPKCAGHHFVHFNRYAHKKNRVTTIRSKVVPRLFHSVTRWSGHRVFSSVALCVREFPNVTQTPADERWRPGIRAMTGLRTAIDPVAEERFGSPAHSGSTPKCRPQSTTLAPKLRTLPVDQIVKRLCANVISRQSPSWSLRTIWLQQTDGPLRSNSRH